jgi:hypothetical protein
MNGFEATARLMASWNRLGMASLQLALASNEVIWRRSMQLAAGTMTPVEAARMMFEKPTAFARAAERAAVAAATRKGPLAVTESFIRPIGTKARGNARRLRRK